MNIKCHWCQKDLEPLPDENKPNLAIQQAQPGMILSTIYTDSDFLTLECPDIHCSVTLELREGYADRISGYYFFLDAADGKRYKVVGDRKANTTQFLIKRAKPQRVPGSYNWTNYDCPMTIKRYLAFKPNKETGLLEGDAIVKRLKNLIIFS